MKEKKTKPSKQFTASEIKEITEGLFSFLHEKPDNIFVNDFLILEKKLFHTDIIYLKENKPEFNIAYKNAMKIEKTKLLKYASADRLNASFVKSILEEPEHNDFHPNN